MRTSKLRLRTRRTEVKVDMLEGVSEDRGNKEEEKETSGRVQEIKMDLGGGGRGGGKQGGQ